MLTNTKIAVAVAFVLGAASAALANDIDQSPSTAQSAREWQEYVGQSTGRMGNSTNSYGYGYFDQERSGKRGHSR